jgi:hypothetical protein
VTNQLTANQNTLKSTFPGALLMSKGAKSCQDMPKKGE